MNAADAERFLARSLADRQLSGTEKQELSAWIGQHATTDARRGVVRHAAFDLVRKAVGGPAAAGAVDWLEAVMKVLAPVEPAPAAVTPGQVETAVAFSPGDGCLDLIARRLATARRSLDLCVFTITDDRIARPILDAHRKGVAVRLVTDNDKAHDAGSDVLRMRDAGIPVKFDPADRPAAPGLTGHMHHKFAVVDGARLLNGSYNWTRGAADLNYENVVETTDPKLVAAFAAEFEKLWQQF